MPNEKYVKGEVVDGILKVPLGFTIAYHDGRLQRIKKSKQRKGGQRNCPKNS